MLRASRHLWQTWLIKHSLHGYSLKILVPWLRLGSHLDLPFAHDLVHDLVVVLVDLGLVIALLIAQDPQGLRALQLNLKLLGKHGILLNLQGRDTRLPGRGGPQP